MMIELPPYTYEWRLVLGRTKYAHWLRFHKRLDGSIHMIQPVKPNEIQKAFNRFDRADLEYEWRYTGRLIHVNGWLKPIAIMCYY